MNDVTRVRILAHRVGVQTCALPIFVLVSLPLEAGERKPRLSKDLADHVSARSDAPVSVIVSGTDAEVETLAARYGATIKRRIKGGAVLDLTGGQLVAMSEDPDVEHLSGDVPVRRMMAVTSVSTGADQVWSGVAGLAGATGRGIGVAVIDSGVASHKSLKGRIVESIDFVEGEPAGDEYGHGTHVAGSIAGSADGGYAGVAPGAHIVSLRVLGADGSGDTSSVINAIDWAIEHRQQYGLRVINLSLGHPVMESYRDDPLCQ